MNGPRRGRGRAGREPHPEEGRRTLKVGTHVDTTGPTENEGGKDELTEVRIFFGFRAEHHCLTNEPSTYVTYQVCA